MNLDLLEKILESLNETDAKYFKIENSDKKIEIIRSSSKTETITTEKLPEVETIFEPSHLEEVKVETFDVKSPSVGFFQRNHPKDEKPVIKLREVVEPGKIMAYVRSMNLQIEVMAEDKGKLVEILVEDGQAVEYDQPLFRLTRVVEEE